MSTGTGAKKVAEEGLPRAGLTSQRQQFVDVGAVRLHVVSQGHGPRVVLLHGFPEFWYSWRHQMAALESAGFCAIAPDLRGYNLSDKPAGMENYRIEKLVVDVVGLLRSLGPEKVRLVGHDWGGTLAWYVAAFHPELVHRLVIMNSPHPQRMAEQLKTWSQRRRSWYMFFFRLPVVSEWIVRTRWFMRTSMRGWAVHKSAFSDDILESFVEAMRRPGAATATLNWYRAGLRFRSALLPKVRVPTLVLWGAQDRALGPELLEGLDAHVEQLTVQRIPHASHWVQQDCPAEVNERLVAFLASPEEDGPLVQSGSPAARVS